MRYSSTRWALGPALGLLLAACAAASAAHAEGTGTRIFESVTLNPPACTLTISQGDHSFCAGSTDSVSAVVGCDPGYVQLKTPEWSLDGSPLGNGNSITYTAPIGAHALIASCGGCADTVTVTVLDEADCAFVPNLVAAFSDTGAAEGTTGIFLPPNIAAVGPGNFAELRYLMRPVTVSASPAPIPAAAGDVTVSATGGNLALYRVDGTPVPFPAVFPQVSLPVTLYLNATGIGTAILRAATDIAADSIKVRVGQFPGLAGTALAGYPDFDWVRSFNRTDTLRTAVDPVRHAERVGKTYRAYVVTHKPPAQWAVNPGLVDVSGGFETGTVAAGTVAANVKTVWTSPDGGPLGTIGRPYDVVYDFGSDGTLDPGDLVDGLDYEEAGLYVLRDLTETGPHAVTETQYSGGSWLDQDLYYPNDIAGLGQVPLVVVSHGNGHNYTWYDSIGYHLASHGYVVMSHSNNTVPGIESASITTLDNTDYFLGHLSTIAGGVLNGHIDGHRLYWIGHSRGGEGVVRAYDRVVDGTNVPAHFTWTDVVCITSIAPTVFLPTSSSDAHAVNYHVIWGAADGDVSGAPDCSQCQCFRISEHGTGNVQTTYVHGADHNDFNCCGGDDFSGPPGTAIGRPAALILAQGYYLTMAELYLKENVAVKEYFTRLNEDFRPIGVGDQSPVPVVIANLYEDGVAAANDILDDYQTSAAPGTSSSGGAVTYDVSNLTEASLDGNSDFTWATTDPMNGMEQAELTPDASDGVVFDWTVGDQKFYEFTVVPTLQDFSDDVCLSFRSCQGTRHPETVGLNGPLSFTVTLRDADGATSSINFGRYGMLPQPYQRTGSGTGAGWLNEFGTVRIRLAEFEANGSGIDLSRIAAVRLQFGSGYGSNRGRVGLDHVELTQD